MAINLDVQDIDRYPGTVKRVSVDQDTIVPTGYAGDEQFVVTVSTSSYSDNDTSTQIQDVYITDFNIGWLKSSGMAGVGGKFTVASGTCNMKVKMDATVSGSDQSGYYDISLSYDDNGLALTGEAIAEDIESKIRNLTMEPADAGFALAYKNATVEFSEGKFRIASGTIGRYYTGDFRSSVAVEAGDTNDCSFLLGFVNPITSEKIAAASVGESLLIADYIPAPDADELEINTGSGVQPGDCIAIMSPLSTEYTFVLNVSGSTLTIPCLNTNSYQPVQNTYSVAMGSRVQVLRIQDPEVSPKPWVNSIDDLIRYGVKSVVNLIDFSS